MQLALTTLGCPDWDLATVCRKARAFGYDGVDFRGLGEILDVTTLPAFTTNVAETRRLLADHGLAVSGISSSLRVCDPDRRRANLDEARRTIDVALALDAANVRVFGEGHPHRDGFAAAAAAGAECVREVLALDGAKRLQWNFETHDHWTRSSDCRRLLDAIPDANFGVTWDACHTIRHAGEPAEATLDAFGDRLRYVHVKDAAGPDGAAPPYVLPGRGTIGLDDAMRLLHARGYEGWLMFEHEKRWHPELEDPDVALPTFTAWASGLGLRPARPSAASR